MPCGNRKNAAGKRIRGADKRKKQRKCAEYIHRTSAYLLSSTSALVCAAESAPAPSKSAAVRPPLFADLNLSRLACPLPPFPDSPKRLHISRRTLPARAPQQTAHPGLAALPRAPVNYP